MITLGLLKTEFTEFLSNQNISTRIGTWAYWVLVDLLGSYDFWWNKKKSSFATVASTAEYFLSHRINMQQILWMGDENNRGKEIKKVNLQDIYAFDSTPTESGNPEVYAIIEQAEVQASNASGTSTAVSSSTTDLAIIVTIRGKVSGVERYETLSLNGTNTVTPTSALTWDAGAVESVALSGVCTGVITVTVGGTTIVSIPPGLQRLQCPKIRLWRVPGSIATLPYIFYQRAIKPVVDGDIIDIPDQGFDAFLSGLFVWGYRNNGDMDFATKEMQIYEAKKQQLYSWSTRELSNMLRKDFNGSEDKAYLKWCLPRTISATVTT